MRVGEILWRRPEGSRDAEENAMSQSHLVVDFPIAGPAHAKALPEELPR